MTSKHTTGDMKTEEILLKAIQKAESNGYKFWNVRPDYVKLDPNEETWIYKSDRSYYASVHKEIFSHEFAKGFWGSQEHDWGEGHPDCTHCTNTGTSDIWGDKYCWQTELSYMVLQEDPIKYLEKFIC